jgi:7,8-dihydropterin-6-yl-methyl-4-(beta-D-ribofuranosyl)aminobenzene 5'-phosphate synthase
MKITIVYDNTSRRRDLRSAWGFSCFVEARGRRILFDTGADGERLLYNMKALGVDPMSVEEVFISHYHLDHTGGLADFLSLNPVRVYCPASCTPPRLAPESVRISDATEIAPGFYSTGELSGIEQSLAVSTSKGLVVIVGCSHPGVPQILSAASAFGKPYAIVGGLHGFREFEVLEPLELVCPTHCTRYKKEIKALYPEKYLEGGVGTVIELPD